MNLNGAKIANGAGTAATLSLSGLTQSGPAIVVTSTSVTASTNSLVAGANSAATTSGTADASIVTASDDVLASNGTGASGSTKVVNANGQTIVLQPNSSLDLDGADDVVTSSGHSNINVKGAGDVITVASGDALWLGDAANCKINIGSLGGGAVVVHDYMATANDVFDLLNGVGGYATTAEIMGALRSDGSGGTLLSLGSAGSLDIMGVARGALVKSDFHIG